MKKFKRKSTGTFPPSKRPRNNTSGPGSEDELSGNSLEKGASDDGLFLAADERAAMTRWKKNESNGNGGGNGNGNGNVMLKTKPKMRKSEPVRKLVHSEEEEEDGDTGGRGIGSQEFVEFISAQHASKTEVSKRTAEFVTNFEKAVVQDEGSLREQVERLKQESSTRDKEFLTIFQHAFLASRPDERSSAATSADGATRSKRGLPGVAFAELQERSLKLVHNANAMVQKFEDVDEITMTLTVSDLINPIVWSEAADEVQETLSLGRRVGLRRVQRLLDGNPGVTNDDGNSVERSRENEYFDCGDAVGDEWKNGWGAVAWKAERATRKLVKVLPVVLDD